MSARVGKLQPKSSSDAVSNITIAGAHMCEAKIERDRNLQEGDDGNQCVFDSLKVEIEHGLGRDDDEQ